MFCVFVHLLSPKQTADGRCFSPFPTAIHTPDHLNEPIPSDTHQAFDMLTFPIQVMSPRKTTIGILYFELDTPVCLFLVSLSCVLYFGD